MATILTRRGTGVPPNSTLAHGELAVDTAAGALYVGDAATDTVELIKAGTANLWSTDGTDIQNTNSGKVGINTFPPQYKLDVAETTEDIVIRAFSGASQAGISLQSFTTLDPTDVGIFAEADEFLVKTAGVEHFRVLNNGDTVSTGAFPQYFLDNSSAVDVENVGGGYYIRDQNGNVGGAMTFAGNTQESITFENNKAAGWYRWRQAGVSKMQLTSDGKFSVGDNLTPSAVIHAREQDTTAANGEMLRLQTTAGGNFRVYVNDKSSTNPHWGIQTNTNENLEFHIGGNYPAQVARMTGSNFIFLGDATDDALTMRGQGVPSSPVQMNFETHDTNNGDYGFNLEGAGSTMRFPTVLNTSGTNRTCVLAAHSNGAKNNWGVSYSLDAGSSWKVAISTNSLGNVGIGTSIPQAALQIGTFAGGYSPFASTGLIIGPPTGSGTNNAFLDLHATSISGQCSIAFTDTGSSQTQGLINYIHTDDAMLFHTNTLERMRIASTGNVGIGESNPLYLVDIFENNGNPGDMMRMRGNVADRETIMGIDGRNGATGTAFYINSTASAGTPGVFLDLNGTTYFHVSGANAYLPGLGGSVVNVQVGTNGILTRATSDATLKENVVDTPYGLNEILALRPVNYNFIDKELRGSEKHIGFIAQEVEEVLPEIVAVGDDKLKGLRDNEIIAVLVKAVQELAERMEALEAN